MVGWYGSQIAARVRPSSHLLVDQCDSITACTFNKKKIWALNWRPLIHIWPTNHLFVNFFFLQI